MAQIKKFQVGGKMFIDGHEIDLEEYYKYASSLNGQARTAAMDMYNSARSGNTVNYDSGRNAATGVNWSDVNQAGLDNADKGKGWTRAKARRQAFWGGKGDDFVRALQAAGRYTIPESPKSEETTPGSLFKTDQAFDYNEIKGEDGKISKVWSDSLGNADQLAYFNSIRDAVLNWDEEGYKTKYTAGDLDKLRNIKAKYDLDNDFFTNLETGFKGGNFDNQELWDNLHYMGFIDPNEATRQAAISQQDPNDPWLNYVNPFGDIVSIDTLKKNNARITKDENGQFHFHGMENNGAWFLNDYDFLKGTDFEDGVMLNGNLYSKAQIEDMSLVSDDLRKIRELINNRRNIYSQNPYEEAVRIEAALDPSQRINYRGIGNALGTSYNYRNNYIDGGWYEYFRDLNPNYQGNYQIADVTGNFSGLNDGSQIFSYINPNAQMDIYGRKPIVFAYRDQNGQIQTYNSQQALSQTLGITPQQWSSTKQISSNEFNEHGFAPVRNFRTMTGNKEDTLFRGRDGSYRLIVGNKYKIIKKGSPTWQILVEGKSGNLTDAQIEKDTINQDNNYSKVKSNKKGGILEIKSLPKFQYGGNVMSYSTTSLNKDVDANYNPTINAPSGFSNGDLTSSDKWQLGAMAADLASVISSFTNASGAGAIVTGVTGLGGTAAQLIADAKRDGLDWGDIGRAGIGLGFDVVGMLPGLGTAGKVGKLGKNIAKASGTIGKAINYATKAGMAAGTISAATQVYNKIQSGEKLNVDDYRNLLTLFTGLGYGTRGAVNAGRASKAASEIGSKMAKNADGTITLKSLGTLKDAKDIKLSKSDAATLEKMMGKKDGAKKIQDFLKSKTGITVEEADLPKILDNYGFDSKSKWFGAKKYIDNEEFIKGKKVLDESKVEHGTGYYFLHGNRRNAVLDKAKNEELLKELYANGEGLSHRTRTYLGNRSVWDPESVGLSWDDKIQNNWFTDFVPRTYKRVRKNISIPTTSTISANPTLPLPFVIGRQSSLTNIPFKSIYPAPSTLLPSLQTTPKSIPTSTSKFTPKREAERKIFREIITDLKNIKSSDDLRQFLLKVGFNGHGYDGESVDNPYREILNKYPRLKQQLIKHIDNNRWFHGSGIDDFVHKYNLKFEKGGKIVKAEDSTKLPEVIVTGTRKVMPEITPYKKHDGLAGRINTVKDYIDFAKANPNYGQQSNQSKSYNPAELGQFNWNKLADLGMSAGRLFTSIGMNNAQHKAMEKSIRAGMGALEQTPTEVYNRFQDNGVTAAYNARANQDRQIKPISSDWLRNAALEQMNKAQADNTELEGRLKLGEMYQQHMQEQNNLRRQYAQQRSEITNRNNAKMAAMNSALAQNDASKITNNFQSLNNFGMELQNKNDQIAQENRAFDRQVAQMQWMNKQNPNSKMTDSDITNMMKPLDPRNTSGWFINRTQYAKKGTKLRSRLDADEQIWVNQNKAAAEAVKKINDNIIKLIMKALS